MKTIVIKSNHGNHRGFNRTWQVLGNFEDENEAKEFLNGYLLDREMVDEDGEPDTSYDGCYFYTITEADYERGIFDGGHFGYANQEIIDFFENE